MAGDEEVQPGNQAGPAMAAIIPSQMLTTFAPPAFKCSEDSAPTAWREYKEDLDNYLMASGLTTVADERKIAILLYGMGTRYRSIFSTFTFANVDDKKSYTAVIAKFDEHFEPKKLTKLYMKKFDSCYQSESESVADYISRLKDIASHCNYGETLENQLCKQISTGLRYKDLREKLWAEDLNLTQIQNKCFMYEQRLESKNVLEGASGTKTVNAAYANRRGRSSFRGRGRGRSQSGFRGHTQTGAQPASCGRGFQQTHRPGRGRGRGRSNQRYSYNRQENCYNCGKIHPPKKCPAEGELCFKCNNFGHFSNVCRSGNKAKVQSVNFADSQDVDVNIETLNISVSETVHVNGTIQHRDVNLCSKMWTVDFETLSGQDCVSFRIDTQADVSILAMQTYQSLKTKPQIHASNIAIRGVGGHIVKSVGYIMLPVRYKEKVYNIHCEILNVSNNANILSEKESVHMGLIQRVQSVDTVKCHNSAKQIHDSFADVFRGVGRIPGEYVISCDPEAKPVVHPARPVPAALRDAVKAKLDQLEELHIIQKIPVGEPTEWCNALHVVPKKTVGDVRITIDPRDLNRALKREYHPLNTLEDVVTRTNGSKYFTVLDANMGYFQIALTHESQQLTAFNTPFGRYKYLRLPMGISVAPEIYQRAMSDMFQDIEGVEIIMDDILIHGSTLEIHNQRLKKVLQRCREKNLKLNPQKTKLCTNEVEYIGHKLTDKGLQISDDKVKAILDMPEPTSIENVRTFLGMVTYLSKFLPNLSTFTEPLRQLVKDKEFYFEESQRVSFNEIKSLITKAPVLKYYSVTEAVTISCDASQSGLGAVLMQNSRPVAYASKALTTAEYAYSQIEKELLAILFACRKFHSYIYGRSDVTVETDHLPLVRIFEKPLSQVPLRLQRMCMMLQHYSFKIVGKSGKEIPVADALSRAYLPDTQVELLKDVRCAEQYAVEVRGTNCFAEKRQEELRCLTQQDQEMMHLQEVIKNGWPEDRRDVHPEVRSYFDSRDELAVVEGIIFKGDRVVIPRKMRSEMLKIVHQSHLGIVRCKQLARDVMYWPCMNSQIEDMVTKCSVCQANRNLQPKEPLMPSEVPNGPWKVIAADLLNCAGSMFLVIVDYFSEFIEVEELKDNTYSSTVIEKLAKIFAVHGIPVKLITDNGPQFSSHKFREFAENWNFTHITTSPYHHQANGMVERANQTVRHMLEKADGKRIDFYLALLNFRNTPKTAESGSPAQRIFGRRTATKLPTSDKLLKPQLIDSAVVKETVQQNRDKAKMYYDRGSNTLEPLNQDDSIRVRTDNKWKPARLDSKHDAPRSYNIMTESGNVLRRNRRDILKTKEPNSFRIQPDLSEDLEDETYEQTQETIIYVPLGEPPPRDPDPIQIQPEFRQVRQRKLPQKYNDFVMY